MVRELTFGRCSMCDSLDFKIIRLLHENARTPFSEIAEKLGISPSIVQIRFNKMKKTGVILGTTLLLDREKFGVKYNVSIGVKAIEPDVPDVIKYMNALTTTESKLLAWPTIGRFNIIGVIMSRDLLEAHKIKHVIKQNPSVTEVKISVGLCWWTNNLDALMVEKELRRQVLG